MLKYSLGHVTIKGVISILINAYCIYNAIASNMKVQKQVL